MAKTKSFEITKDFGDKTLEKVFVKEDKKNLVQLSQLQKEMNVAFSNAKSVCLVAESALSDSLLSMLASERRNRGLHIYIITKNLQPSALEVLRSNCIVREVPGISGNYLICDSDSAFFFDSNLQGYALHEKESVSKLHDLFVYEFWNNATKEFINETKPVAEQTFDVAPVLGNSNLVIDRSAQEKHPYEELLAHAEVFAATGGISEYLKNSASKDVLLYLDKKACEENKDWLLKCSERKIIYTDNAILPLCKSSGQWYILNSSFNKNCDNEGKLFAVKMEKEPVFFNTHILKDTLTYREAAGKTMFSAKDFSKVSVSATDREERSISYDYRQFKKIAKMAESEREELFDKLHLLTSDKVSESVTFNVTVTVKELTKGAQPAPIYAEYEKFLKEKNAAVNSLNKAINESTEAINKLTLKFDEKMAELRKKVAESQEKKNEYEKVKDKLTQKELVKISAELKKSESACTNVQKESYELNNMLKEENKKNQSLKSLLKKISALSQEPETKKECSEISEILNKKLTLPSFDKPKYGTLYKVKAGYEYELTSDEDSESAEEEMKAAGITNVEFVSVVK